MVICLRMGKIYTAKPHQVILRSPLSRIHYYQNKWLQVNEFPIPYTNLQLNPYPNTQLDLFCSNNLSFLMHGSPYVTNQLRGSLYATWSPTLEWCWLQSSLVHYTMKITKLLGHKTLWCTKHSNFLKRMKN